MAAAKARGVRSGRPAVPTPENFPAVVEEWEHKRIAFQEALRRTGLSETTFYRRLRGLRLARARKQQ